MLPGLLFRTILFTEILPMKTILCFVWYQPDFSSGKIKNKKDLPASPKLLWVSAVEGSEIQEVHISLL